MVVSEIGEQWSPQTAPAMQAEIAMVISVGLVAWNASTTIGIRIPKVPQEVPVANASRHPTTKIIAGSRFTIPDALPLIRAATNSAAPRLSVMDFRVHAKVRIMIAGTIALKPSGIQSIHSLNPSTLRLTYRRMVITSANALPMARPTDASLLENAVTKSAPSKNPPV